MKIDASSKKNSVLVFFFFTQHSYELMSKPSHLCEDAMNVVQFSLEKVEIRSLSDPSCLTVNQNWSSLNSLRIQNKQA